MLEFFKLFLLSKVTIHGHYYKLGLTVDRPLHPCLTYDL